MSLYDLHCHSRASDGALDPVALVHRAQAQGVETLALTDHDTVAGLPRAQSAALDCGLNLIPGIELSSLWGNRGVHIVGLCIDATHPVLHSAIIHQKKVREERAVIIAERLRRQGIHGALAGAQAIADNGVIGRPHFAQFLIQAGWVDTPAAAFKKYLGAGKVGDVKGLWPNMATVVGWIRASGGIAVLAHPTKYKLTRMKLCELLREFVAVGGQAVEVICGAHSVEAAAELARLVTDFGLYASCGSDFHVPDQPWQELGAFATLPGECEPVWTLWNHAGAECSA